MIFCLCAAVPLSGTICVLDSRTQKDTRPFECLLPWHWNTMQLVPLPPIHLSLAVVPLSFHSPSPGTHSLRLTSNRAASLLDSSLRRDRSAHTHKHTHYSQVIIWLQVATTLTHATHASPAVPRPAHRQSSSWTSSLPLWGGSAVRSAAERLWELQNWLHLFQWVAASSLRTSTLHLPIQATPPLPLFLKWSSLARLPAPPFTSSHAWKISHL